MIVFDQVWKIFSNGVPAVCDLSLEVKEGEILVLLGKSGSGKTTSMKMINRLIDPTKGKILVDGVDVMEQNPIELRRKIGYAVQHIGLFPHMTVKENISLVPKLLGWSTKEIDERIDLLLSIMDLNPAEFCDRYPHMLSGGQKQRVGVARALAADPPIILMDEPFGALDPVTREQTQKEFVELESEFKKTVIFVTHDIFEAMTLGDRIALMDEGKLLQLGTPTEIIESPASEVVEQFLGQHRFHLSLLTKTVKDCIPHLSPIIEWSKVKEEVRLNTRSSIIEALDLFKISKKTSLPVYANKEYIGNLDKEYLLDTVIDLLMQEKRQLEEVL